MKYRVRWKKDGEEGVENEASWFLVDQQGKFWVYGSMTPVRMVSKAEYDELTPLIRIGDRWLSVEEIERLNRENKAHRLVEAIRKEHEGKDVGDIVAENAKLSEKVERYKEAVLSVLECGECNLYHGYICPMCARGLQALEGE